MDKVCQSLDPCHMDRGLSDSYIHLCWVSPHFQKNANTTYLFCLLLYIFQLVLNKYFLLQGSQCSENTILSMNLREQMASIIWQSREMLNYFCPQSTSESTDHLLIHLHSSNWIQQKRHRNFSNVKKEILQQV